MKKSILLVAVLLVTTLFSSCGGEDKHKIMVKDNTIRINVDEKYTIKAETKKNDNITWSSRDEKNSYRSA